MSGLVGGIQWGSAADAKQVYVALSDIRLRAIRDSDIGFTTRLDSSVGGGMFALDSGGIGGDALIAFSVNGE